MRKDSYMHFTLGQKQEGYEDKSTMSSNYMNPQLQGIASSVSSVHHNPIFNRQKPFLAQVKTKAISRYKQTPSINSVQRDSDSSQRENDTRTKSNSFTMERYEKNKSKYDYLIYAQRQHQLEKEASKELKPNDSRLDTPRIQPSTQSQLALLRQENQCLQQKIRQLQIDNKKLSDLIAERESGINERDHIMQQLLGELQRLKAIAIDYKALQSSYNQLLMQNNKNKDIEGYFQDLRNKYQQAVDHCSKLQAFLKQKDHFLQQTLSSKDYQYHSAMTSKTNQIKSLLLRIDILEQENRKLIEQIEKTPLQKDKSNNIDKFRQIGNEFEVKINQALEENGMLKNLLSQKEGQIQQFKIRYNSLEKIVKAFQQRQLIQSDSKLLSEVEFLKDQLQHQQQQYDRQRSEYQLQILKLQNDIAARRYKQSGTLLDFTDREKLLDSFSNLIKEVDNLKQKCRDQR